MAYGNLLTDVVQSSTTNTPPVFKDGNGTEVGTLCRAWVNINGASGASPTIRASFNVSSVTRNSTGSYTVTFTNAMPDTNYAFVFGRAAGGASRTIYQEEGASGALTTTSIRLNTATSSALDDVVIGNMAIFR